MANERPGVASEIKAFNTSRNPDGSRKRQLVEGGGMHGIYRMTVTQKRNFLGIEVAHDLTRQYHKIDKPYFSSFSIGMELDKEQNIARVKRNPKDEMEAAYDALTTNFRAGIARVKKENITDKRLGRFWATVQLPSGIQAKIGFMVDDRYQAVPATLIMDGSTAEPEEALEAMKMMKKAGLNLPDVIDVAATVKRLLSEKIKPPEMRDQPFVGRDLPFNEPLAYSKLPQAE